MPPGLELRLLLRSGARFAAHALVLEAAREDPALSVSVRRFGPGLVFGRLWRETGCQAVIAELAGGRHHGFDLDDPQIQRKIGAFLGRSNFAGAIGTQVPQRWSR
jgi:hypothetical protein